MPSSNKTSSSASVFSLLSEEEFLMIKTSVFAVVHGDGVHLASQCLLLLLLLKSQQLIGTTGNSLSSPTFLFPKPIANSHLAFLHSAITSSGGIRDRNRRSSPGLMDEISKINNLDDALRFYNQMVRMRPLPTVIDFNQLLGRLVKMKNYSHAISLYTDMCVKGIPVSDYTMNIVINCYCLEGRVDLGFSILGAFFKRGLVPNVITFGTLLRGLFRQHRVP